MSKRPGVAANSAGGVRPIWVQPKAVAILPRDVRAINPFLTKNGSATDSTVSVSSPTAIAKVANQSKVNNKEITISDFINYNSQNKIGFEGVDGYYQFNNNGSIKRNIAIIKVDRGKFTVINQ